MASIQSVKAIQVLDSRGLPTVSCNVILDNGIKASAIVPSGASTGTKEALELRDGGNLYMGKGVQKAVSNINELIKKNKFYLNRTKNYFGKITVSENKETVTRLKFGLNLGKYSGNSQAIGSNICFNANVPVESVLKKKGTFKWGLLKNRNNSFIILSNIK